MNDYFFNIKDLNYDPMDDASKSFSTINRDSIFRLCGFKIITAGKNKWKRITI